ncbi:hypothetical protein CNY89_03155 [Amaricoccus sp. HAR-UPW-R2A-40]|nr:hypothetical protein CNY89_03155 [Amaricoccus sp. HAR-UPW-R2A-40]
MSPELEAHLAAAQAAAYRIQTLLDSVSALEDIVDPDVRDASRALSMIARQQARALNLSLDSSALAKVAS